jgi:hypothetical protein
MKPRVRAPGFAGDAVIGLRCRRRCPSFSPPGGITVQIPEGDMKSQIATPTARAEANQISGPPVMGATENYDDVQNVFLGLTS